MKEKVSNVNFFVIDKYGNHIYKNYAYDAIVGDGNFGRMDPKSWKTSATIMQTKKQVIVEEEYNGRRYVSVKAPLIINDKVEGVIGLAVDITDRKRVEELEIENKLQTKIKLFYEQVAHDICTPLSVLSMFFKSCKSLSESDYNTLRNIETSIRSIASQWLSKYDDGPQNLPNPIEEYVLVPNSLEDLISSKIHEHQYSKMKFNFIKGSEDPLVFIRGDFWNYYRMISNLINNAVEATDGQSGVVDIGFQLKDHEVEIYVQDYGCGMSAEVVEKILSGISIDTTKKTGHGIGLQQIIKTVKQMDGKILIDSKENVGTKITLVFSRSESPPWFIEQIALPKDSLVIVLDDDTTMHEYWKKRLSPYEKDVTVRSFIDGNEAVDFVNSCAEKNKIFMFADYELRNQSINGIDVIEKCGLENRSIIVTSCYITRIKDFCEKAEYIKFMMKGLLDCVPVVVGG